MTENFTLLDTPKKNSLQTQSAQLRAALKDFERTFAVNNDGRKPDKDDIKGDTTIAAKYKEYGRVRDVLAGKLDYEVFAAPPRSPVRKRKHDRVDSGLSWSPPRNDRNITPRKRKYPDTVDPYDAPPSTTPIPPAFLTAIGPTPQRDGQVLGLFDLLSNSAKSSQAMSAKGKIISFDVEVTNSPNAGPSTFIAQTPSQKRNKKSGDLLEHLTDAYVLTPQTGRRHGRTPVSDGKKFMLSQFFATPNVVRYSAMGEISEKTNKTPLRDRVLGQSPKEDIMKEPAMDATPAYLKRSVSFKDRLLNVSSPKLFEGQEFGSSNIRRGPPTLQHFRSVARSLSQVTSVRKDVENDDINEHDDDLDALRELEHTELNVLVKDSQFKDQDFHDEHASGSEKAEIEPTRVWKKKGQKRSTKRARIKPAMAKLPDAPKFVVAEDEDEHKNEVSQVLETQLVDDTGVFYQLNDDDQFVASDFEDTADPDESDHKSTARPKKKLSKYLKNTPEESKTKKPSKKKKEDGKKAGMINPNAQSHMNYRSLKIRNKNSKAKGAGRGRFGRR